jgi:PPOX class probable F420-dependent enzyme
MGAKLSGAVRAFLQQPRFAVLATINADGTAQQTVMWYELRGHPGGDTIVMNTTGQRLKHHNIARDPRVSVCCEDGYRFVTISGRATTETDHETTQRDIYGLARRYNPDFRESDYAVFATQQRVTLYISIDRVIANGV